MEKVHLYLLSQAPWKIITIGVATMLVALALITALAMVGYAFLPVWVAVILHLGVLVGSGWWLARFFATAYIVRRWLDILAAQLGADRG